MMRALYASRQRAHRSADQEPLATYLADHLAGSDAALALIRRIARHHASDDLAHGLVILEADIRADQRVLQGVRARVDPASHALPRIGGWLAEKMLRMKLPLGSDRRGLSLFESLELLAVGIWGKRALWIMLGRIAPRDGRLAGIDFHALERRAMQQHEQIERQRVVAGLVALSPAINARVPVRPGG
jgi:hypothetical protein